MLGRKGVNEEQEGSRSKEEQREQRVKNEGEGANLYKGETVLVQVSQPNARALTFVS